jgi:hypothetical protein
VRRSNTFLVERYIPRLQAADVTALARRVAAAGAELRAEGRPVRWLRSVAIPDDETCLCTFSAHSAVDVEEANRRAGAAYERIIPVLVIEQDSAAEPRDM